MAVNWYTGAVFGLHYALHATATDTELGTAVTPELPRDAWRRVGPDWVQGGAEGHPGYASWPTTVGTASPGVVRAAARVRRDVPCEWAPLLCISPPLP